VKVFVYFNLHKKCWSLKALQNEGSIRRGTVFAHARSAYLLDCKFKVSEKGRQRVLATKRKNVHAGVVGRLIAYDTAVESPPARWNGYDPVTYNPYRYSTFVRKDNERPVGGARSVVLNAQGAWARDIEAA
jgi:hypothetical protein